jgi:5-methylthioribose kinase
MRLVDVDSAADYLRDIGRLDSDETVRVTELTGGVSNIVLLIERDAEGASSFVVKQARGQLRVAEPWFCSVERIWREVEVLRVCQQVLLDDGQETTATSDVVTADQGTAIPATTPRLLFADNQNYLFAMSAAPPHQVWKQRLLAGQVEPAIARACGGLLGQLHAGTWANHDIARDLGDRTFFDDLRIEPYYRRAALAHPALQPPLDRLIDSVEDHCLALVHGDFSPKNLLVYGSQLMLVDFEVGHFGDPAFDLGFFLSHLVLKSLRAESERPNAGRMLLDLTVEFWAAYRSRMLRRLDAGQYRQLVDRSIQHFAGCMIARVDGKSPVDYLLPETQDVVRRIATELFTTNIASWEQVLHLIHRHGVPGRNRSAPS